MKCINKSFITLIAKFNFVMEWYTGTLVKIDEIIECKYVYTDK